MLKRYTLPSLIIGLLFIQMGFWLLTYSTGPKRSTLPHVPSHRAVEALSLGDKQLYFRLLAYTIQTAGDSYGHVTPLKDYNYVTLTRWFELLDHLDDKSHLIPALASYYYSHTQRTSDLHYIVDYLETHVKRNPVEKWWWLGQAVHIAKHKLKNQDRALALSYKLSAINAPNLPLWAKQMPAIILEGLGEKEEAYRFMQEIAKQYDSLPEHEQNYMNYFIKERLGMLTQPQ